jgi:hypothetical protein
MKSSIQFLVCLLFISTQGCLATDELPSIKATWTPDLNNGVVILDIWNKGTSPMVVSQLPQFGFMALDGTVPKIDKSWARDGLVPFGLFFIVSHKDREPFLQLGTTGLVPPPIKIKPRDHVTLKLDMIPTLKTQALRSCQAMFWLGYKGKVISLVKMMPKESAAGPWDVVPWFPSETW